MQALSAKPFVGQEIIKRARTANVARAVRAPVTVRASQEQEAVRAAENALPGHTLLHTLAVAHPHAKLGRSISLFPLDPKAA